MSFKINDRPEFTRTVTILVPEGDDYREDTLKATFRVTSSEDHDLVRVEGMKDFLRDAIVRLDDVVGDDGPMEYGPSLRDAVLAMDNARLALMRTYSEAVTRLKLGN
ncbi:MAG: hypothetical protein EP318_06280 [Rhodobacteraceae bacterium]|nr:MAG: hypothetical protein EP318_06280 [Paracoccaceae bacterium]